MRIQESPIYLKYANKPISDFTASDVQTDLDAIQTADLNNIEIIEYLLRLLAVIKATAGGLGTDNMIPSGAIDHIDTSQSEVELLSATEYGIIVCAESRTASALLVIYTDTGDTGTSFYRQTQNEGIIYTDLPKGIIKGPLFALNDSGKTARVGIQKYTIG